MTVLVARESFVAPGHRAVPKGTLIDSSDPLVKDNPQWFESVEDAARRTPDVHAGTKTEDVPTDVQPVDVANADKPKTTRTRKG